MSLEDSWYEVRIRAVDGRWVPWAGPGDEEWANAYVDSLTMPGWQVGIVRCGIWSTAVL